MTKGTSIARENRTQCNTLSQEQREALNRWYGVGLYDELQAQMKIDPIPLDVGAVISTPGHHGERFYQIFAIRLGAQYHEDIIELECTDRLTVGFAHLDVPMEMLQAGITAGIFTLNGRRADLQHFVWPTPSDLDAVLAAIEKALDEPAERVQWLEGQWKKMREALIFSRNYVVKMKESIGRETTNSALLHEIDSALSLPAETTPHP